MLSKVRMGATAIVLVGAGTASAQYGNAPANQLRVPIEQTQALSAAEEKIVQQAVAEVMLDPTSPLFKLGPQITASQRYCGLVNGKNRFGGFAGYTSFSVLIARDANGRIIRAANPQVFSTSSEIAMQAILGCLEDGYPVEVQGL